MPLPQIKVHIKGCIFFVFLLIPNQAIGQPGQLKKDLDTSTFYNWEYFANPMISDDGKFLGYTTQTDRIHKRLILKSSFNKWERSVSAVEKFAFTKGNRAIILHRETDSLTYLILGSDSSSFIGMAKDFRLFRGKRTEWLAFIDCNKQLTLLNVKNRKKAVLQDVVLQESEEGSNSIYLLRQVNNHQELSYFDLHSGTRIVIGMYKSVQNLLIGKAGKAIAFYAESKPLISDDKAIWYYEQGPNKAEVLVNSNTKALDSNVTLGNLERINGKRLFFMLEEKPEKTYLTSTIDVKIWKYTDINLGTEIGPKSYLSFINLEDKTITKVQQRRDVIEFHSDNFLIIGYAAENDIEDNRNEKFKKQYFIYNCNSRLKIPIKGIPISLSPNETTVLVLADTSTTVKAYKINSGIYKNLTSHLNAFPDQHDIMPNDFENWTFAGWLDNNHALFYDKYDLWSFDVEHPDKSVNMTNGYGKSHDISFKIAINSENMHLSHEHIRILNAFDNSTKQNGFYQINNDHGKSPERLSMGNHFYNQFERPGLSGFQPLKAHNANIWIVRRESADTSRNFYITRDFISFKPISNVHPERNYNWLTTTLINYSTLEGKPSQAILYKPENFDPLKKYPVIFNYYERKTDKLNIFLNPGPMYDNINIPWFVSRGYLVCTPDIFYTIGKVGENALDAIVGAAREISKLTYVDSSKFGLQGHSFGAFETNYIITHSTVFKAAISAEGLSNLVSAVGHIDREDWSNELSKWVELSQGRIGYSLWQRPDLYIENSPIFNADKVTTPLLIMANEKDRVVPVEQGIELFTALRRLGKPVWMLQYQNEDHSLLRKENTLDYMQKSQSFFDYYLKNNPIPDWMKAEL